MGQRSNLNVPTGRLIALRLHVECRALRGAGLEAANDEGGG